MIQKVCERCEALFVASIPQRRFCSLSCANGSPAQERTCQTCGGKFTVRAAAVAKGKGRFCSRSCAGKVRVGEASGSWKGDKITYAGAHKRIGAAKGKASEWFCVDCPGPTPAKHWSYDGLDPDELTGERGKYSAKPEHYRPRCVMCHNRYDLACAARGERNGQAKLTQAEALEIRALYESTKHLSRRHPERWTWTRLAEKFGVHKGAIGGVISGATWAWAGTSTASATG